MIPKEMFAGHVRGALANLYDPGALETHPLARLLAGGPAGETAGQRLRQIVVDALEALRPAGEVSYGRPEWLGYRVLWLRYVEGLSQMEVCRDLAIGRTSFYDHHRQALEAVASMLWDRYQGEQVAAEERPEKSQPVATGHLAQQEALRAAHAGGRGWVDLVAVLDGVKGTILPLADHRGVDLVIAAPGSLPRVYADPAILSQIVLNVLTEGVGLAAGARLELVVGLRGDETIWRLRGMAKPGGLEPELSQRTGFAVSRGLLEVYGGCLWFEEDTQGAPLLLFTLPAIEPKTILLIDDNADALELYRRYLQDYNYVLHVARNGQEATAVLAQARPDLILLDVLMPQQDGWNILQRLKTMPETAEIPVLICSVLSQPDLALVLGAQAVLQKPIGQQSLLNVVQSLLSEEGTTG